MYFICITDAKPLAVVINLTKITSKLAPTINMLI